LFRGISRIQQKGKGNGGALAITFMPL